MRSLRKQSSENAHMTQACLKGNKTREKEGSFKDHAHFYRLTMKLPIFCHRLCKSEGFLTNYPQAKTQNS